jgi:hypothetical protein
LRQRLHSAAVIHDKFKQCGQVRSKLPSAIAPGKATIAVWSPGLDANGNSHLGRVALEELTRRMGWSIFGGLRKMKIPTVRG